MKRRSFFIALLAFCITATAFSEEPPFKITGMKLFSDKIINKAETKNGGFNFQFGVKVGEADKPGSELPGYEFPENQLVQFFSFQFSPGSAGKKLTMTITGEKTTAGIETKIIEVAGPVDKDGVLVAHVSLKQNWPVGLYRADFTFDGKPVGNGGYLVKAVKERVSPIKLQDMTIYTIENGKGVERKVPKPSDHFLEFHTNTTGAKTTGATVVWKFSLLDEAGKPQSGGLTMEIKDWPLEDTTFVHTGELPKDWPVGKYMCEYLVDGALIGTKTLEIKP